MEAVLQEREKTIACLKEGRTVLGIEFGSTRIKAVLIDESHTPIAVGNHDWENRLENRIWTYSLEDIRIGLQDSYRKMAEAVYREYGVPLTRIGAMGFSGMMHGYMPFDKEGNLLVPFRTWRNTMTQEASRRLTESFGFQIPQRWSIAHLYQAVLNGEEHVGRIAFLTTLAGYIHWKLTGQKVLGIGEASGMFPVDCAKKDYDSAMLDRFDALTAQKGYSWKIREILPKVLTAGEKGGVLTKEGAAFLDETGALQPGVPVCPPEGDAGTGMTATDSVGKRTGNVSAGTSVFSMVVLERPLLALHPEIDLVTTPWGDPVAMVHCNNCTSDLNDWVGLFEQFANLLGVKTDRGQLFSLLYRNALEGDPDCGNLMACNYFSGEHITGFEEGRPLFVRCPDSRFTLANFMRTHLYAALGTLKVGMDILQKEEKVKIDRITGHGGLFRTPKAGQKILAAALNAPVSVMETAGEGGAWGIALLAAYMLRKKEGETLEAYLEDRVFAGRKAVCEEPDPVDVEGFDRFIERYRGCLPVERAAVDCMKEGDC